MALPMIASLGAFIWGNCRAEREVYYASKPDCPKTDPNPYES